MNPTAKGLLTWSALVIATPAVAFNWWEWERVLERLTPMSETERSFAGFAFAACTVATITAIAVARDWFKKGAP